MSNGSLKNKVSENCVLLKSKLEEIGKTLYDFPEVSGQEVSSAKLLGDILKENGFFVEMDYLDIKNSFKAVFGKNQEGPKVAFLAEYDALPSVGHGCGHNLVGAVGVVAAIALSKVIDEINGQVIVFGCPAEETNGAKVYLAERGAFDKVDVAMMAHPENDYYVNGEYLAMKAIQFEYFGKSAHASASPEKGINALNAVIELFNSSNALRQHIPSDAKIHGIIKNGGVAANIVPDYACANFYVRAKEKEYMEELALKLENCGKAASLATGARLEISYYEAAYYNLVSNECLLGNFTKNLMDSGCESFIPFRKDSGSTDIGNVSHICPVIHPYFGIVKGEKVPLHTKEFADCTITDYAYEQALITAKALALTGFDIIQDKELLRCIKEEFESKKRK